MSDEFKLQWSVSLPPVAQYAKGHMFNFRADTVDELSALFDEVLASETVQKALDVASLLTGAHTVTATPAATTSSSNDGGNVTPINGNMKTCEHGVREYKTGTNAKTGKEWAGWFCPSKNKSDQCKPVWKD